MKDTLAKIFIITFLCATPSTALAAGISASQASAVLGLLRAFNVEESLIANIASILVPPVSRPSTVGSPYIPSSIGYDLSSDTRNYPPIPFGFAVVGVTAGKAFTHNARLASECDWARLSSATAPTMYLNLNAPYGSTATRANVSSPKTCATLFGAATTSTLSGGTHPEPTVCAGYNYGYNAAKDAYTYASSQPYMATPLWWLDVEEANSWSPNAAVNDAVIQGAMDYLNAKGIRVGIYSVPRMWSNIAGGNFVPVQTLSGNAVTIPTWFPIGISTQVNALNACLTDHSFIIGGSAWIIQYEVNSTAVDQNIAC